MIKSSHRTLTSLLFTALVLCHSASTIAQSKPVKRPPSPLPQMEVLKSPAMDMIGKTAELRVIRVDRIGSGSIQPGEVIRANVWIANGTAVGATVSAASMGPSGQVRRGSSAVTIQPHSSAAVRLDIPVEVPQIRDDQFSTLVGIVATNRRSGSWMAQLWRDGNANDNVLRVSWAVDPSVYTVRVHVRDFYVRDDCDDGSSDPGEWSFHYGAAAANRPWDISAIQRLNNPATIKEVRRFGDDLTVYSNRRYEVNRTLDLNPVSSTQTILVYFSYADYDRPFWGIDNSCWMHGDGLWLTADEWRRGGSFSKTDWNNNVTLNFSISARPVTVR